MRLVFAIWMATGSALGADRATVGPREGGGVVVTTRQLLHPAGKPLLSGGRPLDLALSPDRRTLYVKDEWSVRIVDTRTWTVRDTLWFGDNGGSQHGIAASADSTHIFATNSQDTLLEGLVKPDGTVGYGRYIAMAGPGGKGASYPTGVALSADGRTAWVCLSANNALAVLDLTSGTVTREIPVGVAPYDVEVAADGKTAWVSNWGGRRPGKSDTTAKSFGTDVLVDARGVAASGTVSVIDLANQQEVAEIETGLHPADLLLSPDGTRLYAACANADTVVVIDTASRAVAETIATRPDPALPYGSATNALAISADGLTLYAANGGNNAVGIIQLSRDPATPSRIAGFIPTGWYPGALALDGPALYVANTKGLGARNKESRQDAIKKKDKAAKLGWHDGWTQGLVSKIPLPKPPALRAMTARVLADGRVPETLRALAKARAGGKPVPVPARAGEPSVFEHVVYVIKENRTYDQVFGDLKRGNAEPKLCTFGRNVTPNQHALAEQFVLLDNFYCNGVLSSDGHAWAVEGNASGYLEKAGGGWTRTYDFGTDPLSFSCTGPIWESALAHGLSYRNYGEIDNAKLDPDSATFLDVYKDFLAGTAKVAWHQQLPMDHLRSFSCPTYPGWNLRIPDVLRAAAFLKEFRAAEASGAWPNFITVYLPDNHTSGRQPGHPTPRAQVADNDVALGQVVAAISKSRFWATTAIFVVEDDPQDGYDHVDGHRSPCLVISPYSRLRKTVSDFYNQTGVLHTMELIMGLPPLNQLDAMAPVMTACFGSKADLTPFSALPNQVPLDEMNPAAKALAPEDRRWAELSMRQDFSHPDRANEDALNRIIWASARPGEPYPAAWAGAHGRGLAPLGLALDRTAAASGDDDDD
jgi:YVTN family beta-propeller protein